MNLEEEFERADPDIFGTPGGRTCKCSEAQCRYAFARYHGLSRMEALRFSGRKLSDMDSTNRSYAAELENNDNVKSLLALAGGVVDVGPLDDADLEKKLVELTRTANDTVKLGATKALLDRREKRGIHDLERMSDGELLEYTERHFTNIDRDVGIGGLFALLQAQRIRADYKMAKEAWESLEARFPEFCQILEDAGWGGYRKEADGVAKCETLPATAPSSRNHIRQRATS